MVVVVYQTMIWDIANFLVAFAFQSIKRTEPLAIFERVYCVHTVDSLDLYLTIAYLLNNTVIGRTGSCDDLEIHNVCAIHDRFPNGNAFCEIVNQGFLDNDHRIVDLPCTLRGCAVANIRAD